VIFSVHWLGKFLVNTALCAVLSAILLGAMYWFPPKLDQLTKLGGRRDVLKRDIDSIMYETGILKQNQDRLETDRDFAEKIARHQRRILKNELLFIQDNMMKSDDVYTPRDLHR